MLTEVPRAITFDCYGTLVDWEAGIKSGLLGILQGKGVRASIDDLFRAREDIEFELIQGDYRSYREILALSLKEAFNQCGIPYSSSDGERLAESVSSWPVFPDTRPALSRLAQKSSLSIISNIDNDIIAKTRDRIGAKFHLIVTAQDARAYKPSIRPFQIALRELGFRAEEVLHVSSGFRYDIPPAQELGFRTVWVNRKRERAPTGLSADREFNSLVELADFVDDLA